VALCEGIGNIRIDVRWILEGRRGDLHEGRVEKMTDGVFG
jgi:hypothetical protein